MTSPKPFPWKKVIKAESVLGPAGGRRWKLTLECGHVHQRRQENASYHVKRIRCYACERIDSHLLSRGSGKYPREWEPVENCDKSGTFRLEVPGGWLVLHLIYDEMEDSPEQGAMCFLPDPEHKWKLEEES